MFGAVESFSLFSLFNFLWLSLKIFHHLFQTRYFLLLLSILPQTIKTHINIWLFPDTFSAALVLGKGPEYIDLSFCSRSSARKSRKWMNHNQTLRKKIPCFHGLKQAHSLHMFWDNGSNWMQLFKTHSKSQRSKQWLCQAQLWWLWDISLASKGQISWKREQRGTSDHQNTARRLQWWPWGQSEDSWGSEHIPSCQHLPSRINSGAGGWLWWQWQKINSYLGRVPGTTWKGLRHPRQLLYCTVSSVSVFLNTKVAKVSEIV